MATVTGFTADRMLVIENETVIDGEVVGDNLILSQRGGTQIDAGNVRGPKGDTGATGPPGQDGADGADSLISTINDESAANIYAPRIFATKADLDAWNAPQGSLAVIGDVNSGVWQKDSTGWFIINGIRIFASLAECNTRWPNPQKGAEAWFNDTDTPWYFDGTAWKGKPLGLLGSADAAGAWCHATYVTIISAPSVSFKAGRRYKIHAWLQGGNVTAIGTALFDLRDWGSPENRRTLWNGPIAVGNVGGQTVSIGGSMIWVPPSTQSRTFLIAGSISAGEFRTGQAGVTVEDVGS